MHEKRLRFAMKIGGDYRVFPYRNAWPRAAEDLGLDQERVLERVADLSARAADAVAVAAAAPDVASLGQPLPGRLVDLVAERVELCTAILRAPSARS